MTLRAFAPLLLAALAVFATATPAGASAGTLPTATVLLADYWAGFIEHWSGVFQKQNGIVMAALLLGAVCLFIITRGKWKK